jgi:hypothetical protein
MEAYDYDAQRWVSGPEAISLIRKQARETLAVIDDPGYRAMMGYSPADAAAIKAQAQKEAL